MCILLKLHFAKFDVFSLFFLKVIKEKHLGFGSLCWREIFPNEKAKNPGLKQQMINIVKMERNDCEFAYIESLRGPPSPSSEMDINSIYEYQRMERNNHTSADIKSTGRGKFPPVNRLETSFCLGKFPPMRRLKQQMARTNCGFEKAKNST